MFLVASSGLLAVFCLSANAWAFEAPRSLHHVSSARELSGEELLRIGEIHDVQNHLAEALTYYEQALDLFQATKQRRGEATTLTKIGSILERQGRRETAAARLRDALSLFSKLHDHPVHADALLTLGRASTWLGKRAEAGRLFEQAIAHYSRSRNVRGLSLARIQLGLMQVDDGSPEEGLRLLQQTLDEAQKRHDGGQTVAALLALGDARWIMEEPEAAGMYYEQALALTDQSLSASMEAGLLYRLATICGVRGQQERAIGFAKRTVMLYHSLPDPSGEAAAWSLLASLYQAIGHNERVEEATQQALSIYRQRQVMVHAVR